MEKNAVTPLHCRPSVGCRPFNAETPAPPAWSVSTNCSPSPPALTMKVRYRCRTDHTGTSLQHLPHYETIKIGSFITVDQIIQVRPFIISHTKRPYREVLLSLSNRSYRHIPSSSPPLGDHKGTFLYHCRSDHIGTSLHHPPH